MVQSPSAVEDICGKYFIRKDVAIATTYMHLCDVKRDEQYLLFSRKMCTLLEFSADAQLLIKNYPRSVFALSICYFNPALR